MTSPPGSIDSVCADQIVLLLDKHHIRHINYMPSLPSFLTGITLLAEIMIMSTERWKMGNMLVISASLLLLVGILVKKNESLLY